MVEFFFKYLYFYNKNNLIINPKIFKMKNFDLKALIGIMPKNKRKFLKSFMKNDSVEMKKELYKIHDGFRYVVQSSVIGFDNPVRYYNSFAAISAIKNIPMEDNFINGIWIFTDNKKLLEMINQYADLRSFTTGEPKVIEAYDFIHMKDLCGTVWKLYGKSKF